MGQKMKRLTIFLMTVICLTGTISSALDKVTYSFALDTPDVVIPCHEKDQYKLDTVISCIKKYVPHRRIIVVASKRLIESAEWFDEALFPFTKKDIVMNMFEKQEDAERFMESRNFSRVGWILQQLIKLYSPLVIPDISPNVLIVDADLIFLKPTHFMQPSGAAIFDTASEFHHPYFEHGSRLIPGFRRVNHQHSGVIHHILLQRCVLLDFFNIIQEHHKLEPWKAICKCIDPRHVHPLGSCMSEYELYFNFCLLRSNQFSLRTPRWYNYAHFATSIIKSYQQSGYDFIACHTYI